MNTTSIFFNHSFDKKRLKAFIYWVLKTFGEKDALIIVEELKRMGFYNATKAGLSIGLHDLRTPLKKRSLISRAEITMNKTDQEFKGAELTATERSQRIIDTWHRTSEDLRKQVVDYFSTYDQLNSVYMMALSGARGNFSQVRQLIGMRGLMADPQGQIISFPIRSNLREGLTLTEYFISCSGARKGLVDTALRTADTGYLTRRLVDISHHIVIKKVTCYTSRGIALKTLRISQKILLPLKDRLVGRVLGENIYDEIVTERKPKPNSVFLPAEIKSKHTIARKNQEISPDLAFKISLIKENPLHINDSKNPTACNTPSVLVRSPLTCTYTHELCQLCYGWSMAQGSLVSLGEAVGVIAGQSIGEPGTQLTMRTFHTGGVFSGDLLQEIRAPHSGKIRFPKALQGLLIRTSQGKIAFLIKVSGEIVIDSDDIRENKTRKATRLSLEPSTILFVRQGEKVKSNQIVAELAITSEEGNQPIQSRQTLFSERRGRIVQWKSMLSKTHRTKGTTKKKPLGENKQVPYARSSQFGGSSVAMKGTSAGRKPGIQAYLGPVDCKSFGFVKPPENKTETFGTHFTHAYKNEAEQKQSFGTTQTKLNQNEVLVRYDKQTKNEGVQNRNFYNGTQARTPNHFGETSLSYSIFDTLNPYNQTSFVELSPLGATNVQHYEEMRGKLKKLTLKEIVLSKRHGLGSIEPPKALQLGLLSVIALQVGGSEKTCTKGIIRNKLKFEQGFHFKSNLLKKMKLNGARQINNKLTFGISKQNKTLFSVRFGKRSYNFPLNTERVQLLSDLNAYLTNLQDLNTIAEEGDLVDENYNEL